MGKGRGRDFYGWVGLGSPTHTGLRGPFRLCLLSCEGDKVTRSTKVTQRTHIPSPVRLPKPFSLVPVQIRPSSPSGRVSVIIISTLDFWFSLPSCHFSSSPLSSFPWSSNDPTIRPFLPYSSGSMSTLPVCRLCPLR